MLRTATYVSLGVLRQKPSTRNWNNFEILKNPANLQSNLQNHYYQSTISSWIANVAQLRASGNTIIVEQAQRKTSPRNPSQSSPTKKPTHSSTASSLPLTACTIDPQKLALSLREPRRKKGKNTKPGFSPHVQIHGHSRRPRPRHADPTGLVQTVYLAALVALSTRTEPSPSCPKKPIGHART